MASFGLPPVIEARVPPVVGSGINLRNFNENYILFWNNVALDLNRLTHTSNGPQDGPPVSARALAILHIAIHDAYFGILPYNAPPGTTGLPTVTQYLVAASAPLSSPEIEAKDAVAGAAVTVLNKLYRNPNKPNSNASTNTISALANLLDSSFQRYVDDNNPRFQSNGYAYGVGVAQAVLRELEIKSSEPGADPGPYHPRSTLANYRPYFFDDDPSHPVRLRPLDPNNPDGPTKVTRPYHGPFYGTTAAVVATTKDFKIADPYVDPRNHDPPTAPTAVDARYLESIEDVHRMGGAEGLPSTRRRPDQTATALFWAYDGTNLIGTPPRLYNQIIRQIAFDKKIGAINSETNNREFARLFALANAAMADAGIFCWREKYRYQLWRPLSGVREDPSGPAPGGFARPFWEVLGAPATNSNETGFKPPFPAYPSGHATFGAAAFQIVRRFYDARDRDVGVSRALVGGQLAATQSPNSKAQSEGVAATDTIKQAEQQPQKEDSTAQISQSSAAVPPGQSNSSKIHPEPYQHNDNLAFRFVSDELNGISRELNLKYDNTRPITDQPGDVRTRLVFQFDSMKHAIFSNAISRIWLGVHWHFDAFAGEDIMDPYHKGGEGIDLNVQKPNQYEDLQRYQCEDDGSTKYKEVNDMNWFKTEGASGNDAQQWWYGGVPLGILIADDIFTTGMKFKGSLKDLSMEEPVTRT